MSRTIYACDVGTTRLQGDGLPSFAWARINPELAPLCVEVHYDIECLVGSIEADIKAGTSVALGLESPLFLPEPLPAADLFHGRTGEGRWAWCGQAGLPVTAQGIHLCAWVLRALHQRCGKASLFTLDPNHWPPSDGQHRLFLWEAFVAGPAHWQGNEPDRHMRDAATAAHFFSLHEHALAHLPLHGAAYPINLAAAAALWSGWLAAEELRWLHVPTLIVRPDSPCPLEPQLTCRP